MANPPSRQQLVESLRNTAKLARTLVEQNPQPAPGSAPVIPSPQGAGRATGQGGA